MTAPDRIWVTDTTEFPGLALVPPNTPAWPQDVEYIRADQVQALIAAEREACALIADQGDRDTADASWVAWAIRMRGKLANRGTAK